jgi:hypothetical protein
MGTRAWVAVVVMMIGPAAWMRSGADGWIDSGARASRHAAALDARLAAGVDIDAFGTGNARFDGEWAFASAVMAALANAQIGAAHPAEREACAERAARAVDLLLDPDLRAFDTAAWGTDMLNLGARHEHAVLGYLALALGAERLLDPAGPHADLHDRVVAALTARLGTSNSLLATYPGEGYPVDNAAVLGAIGLHARATGRPVPAAATARVRRLMAEHADPDGLLVQAADPRSGAPVDMARGSGTTLAAYFLGFVDPEASRALAYGARRELSKSLLGFGGMREFRDGVERGGDIDSGPLLFGVGVSPTGFAVGAARRVGDRRWARELWATTQLFGVPHRGRFVTGGPLGDAIMLAMLTAEEV